MNNNEILADLIKDFKNTRSFAFAKIIWVEDPVEQVNLGLLVELIDLMDVEKLRAKVDSLELINEAPGEKDMKESAKCFIDVLQAILKFRESVLNVS